MNILIPPVSFARPWLAGDSLDLRQPLAFTRDELMSAEECAKCIARLDTMDWADATITTASGFVHRPETRNNARVIFDDPELANDVWARIDAIVPKTMCERRAVGVNERFRGYRYRPGQRFAPHSDGCFRRNENEESVLTLILYLNEGMGGGETAFLDYQVEVAPKVGRALFFQHPLIHEGASVTSGVKYVLRTDVMYRHAD